VKSKPARRRSRESAFSLLDLLVAVVVVMLLVLWVGYDHSGERGRLARCQANLGTLGKAIQSDANDHEDGIPPAAIALEKKRAGWYVDLPPYLKPGLAPPKSDYDKKQLWADMQPFFICPSDPIRRRYPCSYSMSGYDMTPENWPPKPDNATGVGLWWDNKTIAALLDHETGQAVTERPELLPRLKRSVLLAPADTILLTEFNDRNNTLEFISSTRVWGVNQQQGAFKGDTSQFHFGKFNYLMADGHVELLTKLQTGGIGEAPAGIWTIRAGD